MGGLRVVLIVLVLSVIAFKEGDTDVFSAVCKLEMLVFEESKMIRALQTYVTDSEELGHPVRDSVLRFLSEVSKDNLEAFDPGYAENPLNAFRLVRRVFQDWTQTLSDINCNDCLATHATRELNKAITHIRQSSSSAQVTSTDIEGAALALFRLWHTYKLDLQQLFEGRIRDHQTRPLPISDLVHIITVADERKMYKQEIAWLEELRRLSSDGLLTKDGVYTTVRFTKMLANAYFQNEMPWDSVRVLKHYLREDPDNKKVLRDLKYFETKTSGIPPEDRQTTEQSSFDSWASRPSSTRKLKGHYEALCRGDIKRPISVTSKLKCYLSKTPIPIYFGKEEVLNYSPRLSMFYDVITEKEQSFLKNEVLSKFDRSTIVGENNNPNSVDDIRVSQTAWLTDTLAPIVRRITRRVELFTGLSTKISDIRSDAEELQVLNYGVGGMYEPHPDFFGYADMQTKVYGNSHYIAYSGDRVATWLYYLNDVKEGGATVFVNINVTVPVVKGAAAFWFNMLRNGQVDERTWHAGCPVLLGSKWVANKWIREAGQMFRRPCGLTPKAQDEKQRLLRTEHSDEKENISKSTFSEY